MLPCTGYDVRCHGTKRNFELLRKGMCTGEALSCAPAHVPCLAAKKCVGYEAWCSASEDGVTSKVQGRSKKDTGAVANE